MRNGRLGTVALRLPAVGRQGDPPPFPLARPNKRERELWKQLWKLPQAVAWEQMGCEDVVARYVRCLALAEERTASKSVREEARRFEAALGRTPEAMLRLRWTIEGGAIEPETVTPERRDGAVLDIRKRLKAVD